MPSNKSLKLKVTYLGRTMGLFALDTYGEIEDGISIDAEICCHDDGSTERIEPMKDLICYCFEYSEEDIHHDYLENGKSTIMEKIQMEKKFGNCQCATKNPKGK